MRAYKYPFLFRLADLSIDLQHIDDSVFQLAIKRIDEDLGAEDLKSFSIIPELSVSAQEEKRLVAAFAVAKLIVSFMDRGKWNRFSVMESKRARAYLDREGTDDSLYYEIASKLSMRFESPKAGSGKYLIPVCDYLRHAPREKEYMLSSKEVGSGKVHVSFSEFKRVVESWMKTWIFDSLSKLRSASKAGSGELHEKAKLAADQLMQKHAVKFLTSFGDSSTYPPCIRALLQKLADSENLTHSARWVLASFLLKAGKKQQEIVELFRPSPDFNEKITSYQVEYAAKKEYSVPNCSNLRSMQLCVAECGTKNPMQYRKGMEAGANHKG